METPVKVKPVPVVGVAVRVREKAVTVDVTTGELKLISKTPVDPGAAVGNGVLTCELGCITAARAATGARRQITVTGKGHRRRSENGSNMVYVSK